MSDIVQVVRALCLSRQLQNGCSGTPSPISPAAMRGAFGAVLDGGASDLEVGALMTASAVMESHQCAQQFAEIVLGLSDAVHERMTPLNADGIPTPVVVLPNYGDDGASPAMPLIALLLRRLGVRVLIHGAIETRGGLLNCGIFREFGVLPSATRGQAARQLAENGLALLPATLFSPGLAAMLSLRNRLGIRTPAHAMANMLMPVVQSSGRCLHVMRVAPWLKSRLANENVVLEAPVLLVAANNEADSAGLDCGVHIAFRDGENHADWEVLLNLAGTSSARRSQEGVNYDHVPAQHDPRKWADWTRHRLDGKFPMPARVANEFTSCLYGCGYTTTFHQAKAIAAVEFGAPATA